MSAITHIAESQSTEDLSSSVEPLILRCRRNLVADLRGAPKSDLLVRYFQGGKMLRARLVFMAASAVGGDPRTVSLAAQAIELLHGASLVHDDIIDESAERRGFPALHVEVGIGTALALGDYLMLRAFAVLAAASSVQGVCHGSDVMSIFSEYAQDCCRGQISELGGSTNIDSEEKYIAMVRGKTGSLFASATTIGATLAGGGAPEIEALREFGLSFGVAFQIYDDMLELVGTSWLDGEPIGRSLAQGRPSLSLIYLAKYDRPANRGERLPLSQSKYSPEEISSLLKQEDILDLVITVQNSHIDCALDALKSLRSSRDIDALSLLVHEYRCGRIGR